MSERVTTYWLVTTAVYFGGIKGDKWQPAVRVCLSYRMAEKYAEQDKRHQHCRNPQISGPFYVRMPTVELLQ